MLQPRGFGCCSWRLEKLAGLGDGVKAMFDEQED